MNKEMYAKEIIKELEKKFTGVTFEVKPVVKSGTELTGILCKFEDLNAAPTVYVDYHYEQSICPENAAIALAEAIETSIEGAAEMEEIAEIFQDYERVKEHLTVYLYPQNEYSEDKIHRRWNDLNMVAVAKIATKTSGDGMIAVKPEHLETWGVSADEVFEEALKHIDKIVSRGFKFGDDALVVLSNKDCVGGAVVMANPEFDDVASDLYPDGYYIIPSSRHEVILVDKLFPLDTLKDMIHDVNSTVLDPGDFLSDSVYTCEDGEIVIVDEAA